MTTRKTGLDVFRILCCIGVLVYHVVDDILPVKGAYCFYYGASFCVSGFFLLSGFLIGEKDHVEISYCEAKILGVLKKLFLWIVFWSFIQFVRTGEFYDIWDNFLQGADSRGILPVSWFLFTYCLLMVLAYPLHKILRWSRRFFALLCAVWIVALSCGMGSGIVANKTQALWIHLYGCYFSVGMLLPRVIRAVDKYILVHWQQGLVGGAFVVFSGCYFVNVRPAMLNPQFHYGSWYYTGWLICLFWFVLKLEVQNQDAQKLLQIMSRNTVAIYLGHYPLLLCLEQRNSVETLPGAMVIIIFLFLFWQLAGEVCRRLPVTRTLV